MEKSEFTALPLAIALGVLWDRVAGGQLAGAPMPELPRAAQSPKYDSRMKTRDGYVYCSECDIGQLRYYLDRAKKPGDPKYEAKNQKDIKALTYFIAWREQNPDAIWEGERYQQGVKRALPPSSRPRATGWDDAGEAAAPAPSAGYGEEDPNDSIPF